MDALKDIAVPLFLLVLGIAGKWLVKQKWDDDMAYMGPDLILTAVGGALAHVIDQSSIFFWDDQAKNTDLHTAGKRAIIGCAFIVCAMGLYIFSLKFHQWMEPPLRTRFKRICWLGLASNFVGLMTLAALLFLFRRV